MDSIKNIDTIEIGIVVARFNASITQVLLDGAKAHLVDLGFSPNRIHTMFVPGAVELPLAAQHFCEQTAIKAVVCLGAVIKGETDHYDYVCQQVGYGCQRVMLDHKKPVIFGVLTTTTAEQAKARAGGAKGHKGKEAAQAAYDMLLALS